MANPFAKVRLFYSETLLELKKSQWPNAKELRELTAVVCVGIVIIGAFIALADFALYNFVALFTKLVG
ncbi:preprotein translocase subunit SecE [Cerasicoccus frondis]|uniref:preprotein translocase subunit SecE n=1 Tax=Cerasicoccus frondis TaxID=490090 RepID=UPI002852A627|nr:preprotein translocase subunit SecE [Cerasicoccus frondis]